MSFVEKGTTIVTSKPFAFVLSSKHRTEHCDHCLNRSELLKCAGCNYVYYCGKTCQKIAWKSIHKFECKRLKKISPRILPDAARLLSRIIITLEEGQNEEESIKNEKDKKEEENGGKNYWGNNSRTYQDLMSHKIELKEDKTKMEHVECLWVVMRVFLGQKYFPDSFDIEKFLELYGKMCINSFTICYTSCNGIGTGIYLVPSSIDHSCEPNAQIVYEGTTLILRTLKDFPNFQWSQLRISYIDTLQTADERKKALQSQYFFVCDCPKCAKPSPKFTAVACQNPLCTNPCNATDKKCSACGCEFPSDFPKIYDQVEKFLKENEKATSNAEITDWDLIQKCLKMQEGILHPLNVRYTSMVNSAFNAAILLGYWEEAEVYGKRSIEGYLECCGKYIAPVGNMYLELGLIQWNSGKVHEAAISAEKAKSILTVTHGENHSIFKNHLVPLLFQIRMKMMHIAETQQN